LIQGSRARARHGESELNSAAYCST
jgi:hypothetical protein